MEKQPVLIQIGRCYSKLNDSENAIKTYEHAILLNTKNYFPYLKLGWLQVKN